MPDRTDDEPIQLSADYLVEFHDTAINLTGIPDEEFRSVDADGQPLIETETLSGPLIEFEDVAINLTGIPDEAFAPLEPPFGDRPIPAPGANGPPDSTVPPPVPPKSV